MNASIHNPRRRGLAMMMVLIIVAAAGILSYALLSSAQIHAQVASAAAPRLQRQYLAESGLNLSLYYLHNPAKSPVSPVYGEYGNVHYPGETDIALGSMPGRLTTTVTNTANGAFALTSTATLDGETETATATVQLYKSKTFDYAANLSSNVTLGNNVSILGGLITDGALLGAVGSTVDTVLASNGSTMGGTDVPAGTVMNYPVSMTHYLPYYFYNGKRYTAKKMSTMVLGGTLLDLDLLNNPCNVWYSDQDVKFLLATVVPGTIVMSNQKSITLQGSLTITPLSKLPALVATKDVIFSGNLRSLITNGTTFVAGNLKGTGTTSNCSMLVNGAFISGRTGWPTSGYTGSILFRYDKNLATTTGVFDQLETVNSMTVQSWETNQGRPQ